MIADNYILSEGIKSGTPLQRNSAEMIANETLKCLHS